jgi:hypothetical protein
VGFPEYPGGPAEDKIPTTGLKPHDDLLNVRCGSQRVRCGSGGVRDDESEYVRTAEELTAASSPTSPHDGPAR